MPGSVRPVGLTVGAGPPGESGVVVGGGALVKTRRTDPAENTDMQAFYMKTGSVDKKMCPLTSAR